MEELIKVDFHCHTSFSPDSMNRLPQLLTRARLRGLDRLVITDHNRLDGALAAKAIDPEFVIMGEEILTTRGELLAAFVKEEIPRDLSPEKAIGLLRDQGAFISVSHPFDPQRGWKQEDLLDIVDQVDAVETYNARCLSNEYNDMAAAFALQYNLGGTVGSDSHTPFEVGKVGLELPLFQDAEELKRVIRSGKVQGKLSPPWVHVLSGTKYKIYRIFMGDPPKNKNGS
jgi:predicted metal-dependent phosphoesterase TrpH